MSDVHTRFMLSTRCGISIHKQNARSNNKEKEKVRRGSKDSGHPKRHSIAHYQTTAGEERRRCSGAVEGGEKEKPLLCVMWISVMLKQRAGYVDIISTR